MPLKPKAVVLLSGGVDSTTTLAIAKQEGFETYALSFRYGQRHEFEIEAARRVAGGLGAKEHVVVQIDLRLFGGSALRWFVSNTCRRLGALECSGRRAQDPRDLRDIGRRDLAQHRRHDRHPALDRLRASRRRLHGEGFGRHDRREQ